MSFSVRFATEKDIDQVMHFIEDNWKKGHILSTDRDFMIYEHLMGNRLTFALAIDDETNEIIGMNGYIQNKQNVVESTVWTVIWKVIEGAPVMTGINILKHIVENSGARYVFSCGIVESIVPIYRYLKYTTGELNHYYRLNRQSDFRIAKIYSKLVLDFESDNTTTLFEIKDFEEFQSQVKLACYEERIPYKDEWYVQRRYFNHPVFTYKIFVIQKEGISTNSILIAREVECNERKVLRIVDFIGESTMLSGIGLSVDKILIENSYEYIDFYCFGIEKDILNRAGFNLRDASDTNVIPNYFEPFVQENIKIRYFTTVKDKPYFVFKADGDQDRPSRRLR